MRFRGRLKGIQRDWQTNTPLITFTLSEGNIAEVNDIQETELVIDAHKYHKKRSLNANAYMWELLGKIATHKDVKSTPQEVYEKFIQDIRIPMLDDDGNYIVITVKSSTNINNIDGHWCYYTASPDGKFNSYYQLKGSSKFDTKEMGNLIDLIVDDAKELGIETLTPDELEKMKGLLNGKKIVECIH